MSTQHRDQLDLPTKLDRIEARSRQDSKTVFNNLGHVIDLDLLRRCFHSLDGSKALGIDGLTKEKYKENLEKNLQDLLARIRRKAYHPNASRIVEIEKSDGGKRPLAISCFEDKLVQEVVKRIVENIFEPIFLDCSHGFRPKRGCQTALVALNKHLMNRSCGAVLEIDLQKYFNTIPHEPLIRMLRLKIADEKFLQLIIRLLKAPSLDLNGTPVRNEIGSPQGSILSPVLANIYLHYVLDLWFTFINRKQFGNGGQMVRYADDAVFTFGSLSQAESFRSVLESRLNQFGISLNAGKTKAIVNGQGAATDLAKRGERVPTFTFLGFLHVWGKSWNRKLGIEFWRVKRRTCPIRFRKKLSSINQFIKSHRHEGNLIVRVRRIVIGYLNYFAINDNKRRVEQLVYQVARLLYKWWNRRSQKRSLTWVKFRKLLKKSKFPQTVLIRNLFFASKTAQPC